jgi:hypothetical protein
MLLVKRHLPALRIRLQFGQKSPWVGP